MASLLTSLQSAYSGFTPQSIPGCALWLDAADTSTMAFSSGSNISSWRDKSGNARNFTATLGNFTSQMDGSRRIVNIPNTTYMTSTVPMTLAAGNSWMFVVTKLATTADAYLFDFPTTGNAFRYGWAGLFIGSPGTTGNGNDIITPGSSYINGTLNTTTTFANYHQVNGPIQTAETTTTMRVSSPAFTRYYVGTVAEIIFYTGPITSDQRQQVEGYLASKWGLAATIPATHPFKALPPFTRPFLPVDIPSCSLWLDAADSSTLAFSSSTNVSTWSDKSGFGNNCTNQSVGTTITYPGTRVNGLNSVNFAAGCIRGAFNGTSVINTTNVSIFIVAAHTAANNNLRLFSLTPSSSYQDDLASQMLVYCSANYQVTFYRGGVMPTAYTVTQNVPFMYTVTQTSGTGAMWLNGGSNTTAGITTTAFAVTNYNIGTQYLANQNYTGLVSEVLVYNILLTSTQRQQVESYLANKWGLRALTPTGHYARLAPPLSMAFLPPQISGCTLWLDGADSAAVIRSGSTVSQWSDKSGNGYHFIIHPSHTSPTYSLNAINGVNSIFFQNGSGKQNLLYNNSVPVNGPAFSIFTVARRNASAPSYTGGNYILTDTGNVRLLYITYSSDFLLTSTANSASGWNDIAVNTPGKTLFATTVTGMVVSGSVLTPYVSGTAQNTKGGTTTSFTGLSVGDVLNSGQSGQGWTGFICEILIYSVALTTQQRQQVEGYLSSKWGVSSGLPNAHPFKGVKP